MLRRIAETAASRIISIFRPALEVWDRMTARNMVVRLDQLAAACTLAGGRADVTVEAGILEVQYLLGLGTDDRERGASAQIERSPAATSAVVITAAVRGCRDNLGRPLKAGP